MSWHTAETLIGRDAPRCDPVETVIVPRSRDVGGFAVRRALPSARRQMVGPFIFLDQMGPVELLTGQGLDVRPHPHIGLATLTWLVEGELMHRDSLGSAQRIRPGDVNWMIAGSGIAHSERTPDEQRPVATRLAGLQAWIALPARAEESDPGFAHHEAVTLPVIEGEGKRVVLLAGSGWGERAPVETFSETIYADATLAAGASLPVAAVHDERALYLLTGAVEIAGDRFEAGSLLILHPGDDITVTAATDSRLLLLGGQPMDGPRFIWWNFVSSRKDRIEQAKADWQAGRFEAVPGDDDVMPLPGR
ncbi:MAG: pirin family protein [Inquilinus sp.]|nr:pirin family protein [Inquilinus sp.]